MKTTKILTALLIAACVMTWNSAFANGNQPSGNSSMQEQGENLAWLKDRFNLLEEKVFSNTVDRIAVAEFNALQMIILETAQKAAWDGSTPSATLSQIAFFSGDENCSFGSSLAKIVNTQGKLQLGISQSDCKGLTLVQIKQIDFSKLDLSSF